MSDPSANSTEPLPDRSFPSLNLEVLDHPSVLTMIFHPRKDPNPPPTDPRIQECLFQVEEGVSVGSRFYVTGQQDPIILYFHGNGEIASDYDDIASIYTDHGISLLVLEYRGYGRSEGAPSVSAMIRDARTLFQAASAMLASQGFGGDVWIMGRSLGSASALEVARSFGSSLRGLIVESGFADTVGLLGRLGVPVHRLSIPQESADLNVRAIWEVTAPTLIIHGEWDQIIPVADGKALFQASASAQKELVVIPQAGHNDLLWLGMDQYMDAIARFVKGEGSGGEQ